MSASDELYKLAGEAKRAESDVATAKSKTREELQHEVQRAREASQTQASKLKSAQTNAAADASNRWAKVQKGWTDHIEQLRTNAEAAKDEHDAKRAEHRAERAESDAESAVAFAYAAFEEAEYAVLDAALARVDADAVAAR
jgi:hypothetical protein